MTPAPAVYLAARAVDHLPRGVVTRLIPRSNPRDVGDSGDEHRERRELDDGIQRGCEPPPAGETIHRTRNDKVNLAEKLRLLDAPYKPGVVGYLNDYKLLVAKIHGDFVWHKHDETDECFLVVDGRMTIQLRDRDVELEAGELFVVPRGVEHRPTAEEEAHVLLIEPLGTANTGDAGGELTAPERRI